MTRFGICSIVLVPALLAVPRIGHAAESYDNCTGFIASLPTTITTQGTWCLKSDLTTAITSGAGITIATNNVTIDCNDFKLGGLAAGVGTQAYGIYAIDRLNATVRHCSVRGFYAGVVLFGSNGGGHLVEDNRFDGNTAVGIQVESDDSVVRRNWVINTGGSTVDPAAYGIYTYRTVDVLDNTVSSVLAKSGSNGSAYGVFADSNIGGNISGNRIRGLMKAGTGSVYGIVAESGANHLDIRGNALVSGDGSGTGVFCWNSSNSARDNTISQFGLTAISSCTNGGGNVVIP